MVGEATMRDFETYNNVMDGEEAASAPAEGSHMHRNMATLMHDLTELMELHLKLLSQDLTAFWTSSRRAAVLVIVGIVLALGSIPVLLLGVSSAIVRWSGMAETYALLGTGLIIGVLPALALIMGGLKKMQSDAGILHRSSEEMANNLAWFQRSLRHSASAKKRRSVAAPPAKPR